MTMTMEPGTANEGGSSASDQFSKAGSTDHELRSLSMAQQFLAILVHPYSAVLSHVVDDQPVPVGSGTFITRTDGQQGIITSGQVVDVIRSKDRIVVSPVTTSTPGPIQSTEIEAIGMESHREEGCRTNGPDLGWIPLSAHEVTSVDSQGAVFFNRAECRVEFECETRHKNLIFGCADAAGDAPSGSVTCQGLLFGGRIETAPDKSGWDCFEHVISNDDRMFRGTRRGMSGGAVWTLEVPLEFKGQYKLYLSGIVFAEGADHEIRFIAHGKDSIRRFLHEA